MSKLVCCGAILKCCFGNAPSSMVVLPKNRVVSSTPAANIMDYVPLLNILPFGLCCTLSNPVVSAATSAAGGVLTPMPCIPATAAPWAPGSLNVLIAKFPALNDMSMLMCSYGGVIKVQSPGQRTVSIP